MKHLLQSINLLEQILYSSYTGFCKAQVHLDHCMIMDTCKKFDALLSWLLRFLFLDRTQSGKVEVFSQQTIQILHYLRYAYGD